MITRDTIERSIFGALIFFLPWAVIAAMDSPAMGAEPKQHPLQLDTASGEYHMGYHGGGLIDPEIELMKVMFAGGYTVRITEGCGSVCTIWLAYPKLCVDDGALFMFHAGQDTDNPGVPSAGANKRLMDLYPPAIDDFFTSSGADQLVGKDNWKTLEARVIHDLYPETKC